MKLLLLILLSTLLLLACESELPLPAASPDHKIVLLGELTADDSMFIRAGQSISLNSGGVAPDLIRNLSVIVTDNSGGSTALTERDDYRSLFLFTVPFTNPRIIQPGHNYNVIAKHAQLGEATARIAVPAAFTSTLRSSSFATYNGDSVLSIDLDILNAAADAQFVLEAVRQSVAIDGYFYYDLNRYSIKDKQDLYDSLKAAGIPPTEEYDTTYSGVFTRSFFYTTDQNTDNGSGAGQGRLFRRMFLQARSFGGISHHTQILIPRKNIYGDQGLHAQTIVYVKSIAPDYYTFLKSYEAYDPYSGPSGNGNVSQLTGNIAGGFGMIGGVYRWGFYFFY